MGSFSNAELTTVQRFLDTMTDIAMAQRGGQAAAATAP